MAIDEDCPRPGDVYRPRLGGRDLVIDSFDSTVNNAFYGGVYRYGDGDAEWITYGSLREMYTRVSRAEVPVTDVYAIAHCRARKAKATDPERVARAIDSMVDPANDRHQPFDEMVAACIAYDKET